METTSSSPANLLTPEMELVRGVWKDGPVSPPVTESDIRRWAVAVYWPDTPPAAFWDKDTAAAGRWGGIVAPEEFNPFAWPAQPRHRQSAVSSSGLPIDEFGVPVPHREAEPAPGSRRIGGMNTGRYDEYEMRMRPGDEIRSRSRLAEWQQKTTRFGPSLFITTEVEWTNQRNELVRLRRQSSLRYFPESGTRGGSTSSSAPAFVSEFPAWSRKTDLEHWNRFAAVNDEFVDIHMIDEAGRKAGNPDGAFGMGNLRHSYVLNALREWFGTYADIRRLACEFRALNRKGDILTVKGAVTDTTRTAGGRLLELRTDVVNQDGASTCPGTATVFLSEHTRVALDPTEVSHEPRTHYDRI